MGAIKVADLCCTCKESPPRANTRKRKFKECVSCRVEKAEQLRKGRASYHKLKGHVGQPVSYYECGWRCGYLTLVNRHTAAVQPLGVAGGTQPAEEYLAVSDVKPEQSPKYPTLEDWAKFAGWREKKKVPVKVTPTLFTPGAVVASVVEGVVVQVKNEKKQAVNFHLQAAASDNAVLQAAIANGGEIPDDVVIEKPAAAGRARKPYDVALAIEMYAAGKTVQEIALAQGFGPGNGLNKTRTALREAGVWKK